MFERWHWTYSVHSALLPALGVDINEIKQEVISGECMLFLVKPSKTWVVLRVEGNELVVVAMVGSGAITVSQALYDECVKQGMNSLRFHTKRPGLARLLKKFNPVLIQQTHEYIYKVSVQHGRTFQKQQYAS